MVPTSTSTSLPSTIVQMSTHDKYEEIVSSLGLQISLYFHWRYSIIFIIFYFIKYLWINDDNIFIPIITILWSIIEIIRIYLGYAGNLSEQVPHLFGFLFLTIFPQMILIIIILILTFNTNNDNNNHNYIIIDKILNIFQILFIIFQLIFGYIAIKNVINSQTLKFKLRTSQRAKQKKSKLLGNNDQINIHQTDIKQD